MNTIKFFVMWLSMAYHLNSSAQAPYKLGEKVPSFTLTNVLNNASVSLNEFNSSKAVTIIFTNTSCPFSKLYDDRLNKLIEEYKSRNITFLLINPGNNADENKATVSEKISGKNYACPYLMDSRGEVSKLFGASKTPEAFVLKSLNGSFTLVYKGAIDDNPQVASDVSRSFVKEALNDILSNQAVKIPEKRPSGCMINVPAN